MGFNYYYGKEADQFTFIKIPKVILTGDVFAPLSIAAKLLYGVLLDRMSLSMKNGWLDSENRVYIIYQIAEIQEDLGFSKKKAIDYLVELERFGLVEKKRRGLGLPSILYVKSFMTDDETKQNNGTSRSIETGTSGSTETDTSEDDDSSSVADENSRLDRITAIKADKNIVQIPEYHRSAEMGTLRSVEMGTSRSAEMRTSRSTEIEPQEVPKSTPLISKTEINNNYRSENKSNHIESTIVSDEMRAYGEIIKENIELDTLVERNPYDLDLLRGIYDLVLETVMSNGETMLIASNQYPTELVKSKFLKLNSEHIQYVIDCLNNTTVKVKNIKKYLLAALFNASSTIGGYYQAQVNHDMANYGK